MILQAAIAAWAALGQIPLSTEAELPNGEKVSLAADQLLYEPAKEMLVARGHTVLRTERISVRADEVIYDQANQVAVARGNVMFVSGMMAAIAEEVRVDIRSLEATVQGGLFLRKRNVTEAELLAARTPYELKKAGTTVLTLTGTRIKRIGPNEFLVDGLSFTPCDCDPTEPSWRVEASSAEVELGERAILTWPVVYVYQVPIFAVPWLYLPLSDRRTGILVPKPNFSYLNGFSLDAPVFVTLGDSYDLTFTPGYYLGNPDSVFGVSGGRMQTEFRYAPSERTRGRATLGLLYDTRKPRDPVFPDQVRDGQRGMRGEASLQHIQELGNGWFNRVDAGFVSDGFYFLDVTADVLARQAEYLRSTATLYRRTTWDFFGVDAVLRQPIYGGNQPFGFDTFRRDFQRVGDDLQEIHGPRTFARGPGFTWAVPERTLAGPLWAGGRAELVRLGPLGAGFGDEGSDGLFRLGNDVFFEEAGLRLAPRADPDGTQGNLRFDPGEREARDRLDLHPRLSLPLGNSYARFVPYASWRQTLWFGERSGQLSGRGYPMGGATLGTALQREFGKKEDAVRHAILPRLHMRYVPFVLGGVPGTPYDEIDASLPDVDPELRWPANVEGAYRESGLWHLVAEVGQELGLLRGGGYEEKLRLDLGQGFDLLHGRVADTFARLRLQQGPLSISGIARYDLPSRKISQISAGLNLDNGRGTALWAAYDNLIDVGSDPLRAGVDALVGPPLPLIPFTAKEDYGRAEQVTGGLRTLFPFGLGLRYEAVVQPAARRPLRQQLVGLSYGPGCNCWRLEVYAYLRPDFSKDPGPLGGPYESPQVGASLSISEFGSFGTGG